MNATASIAATGATRLRFRFSSLGPVLVVLVWELAAHVLTDAYVLAAPSAILGYLYDNAGLMTRALGVTLSNAAAGFFIGNVTAIFLAAIVAVWPASEKTVRSFALLVFCLPLVATGPILRVIFGPGPLPQIVLAALAVYYTTFVPLLVGLRALPSNWLDLVSSYGRGRFAALIHVRARAAIPYLVAGLQISAPAAFLGAMIGEFTGAERGMGVLTIRAMRGMNVEMTWALALVATAVSVGWYVAIGAVAKRFLKDEPPVILAAPNAETTGRGWPWTIIQTIFVAVIVLFAWWAFLRVLDLNTFFAKGPLDVAQAVTTASDAAKNRDTLLNALAETSVYLVPGYVVGLSVGALLAMLVVMVPAVAGTALPIAIALRSVPIITTAPLVVLLLGRGAAGTIVLVSVMVFFPTFVACLHGLKQAPGRIVDVFDVFAAGPMQKLIRIRIPAMLPALFAAAKINVPASVLAVTVVEWLATGNGLGSVMALSASLSDYDMLWSAVALVAILSVLGYGAVGMLERRVLGIYAPEQLK